MGALGFLGGFSRAATQSQQQGQQNQLAEALALYKLKSEMETDPLRRAYLLSRIMKPPAQGAGVKLQGPKGEVKVWYPASGQMTEPPQGYSFYQNPSQQSPITKTLMGFLNSKGVANYQEFQKLDQGKKQALYNEFLTTIHPTDALREKYLMMQIEAAANNLKMQPLELRLLNEELKDKPNTPAAAGSDIIPGAVPDITNPLSWGDTD